MNSLTKIIGKHLLRLFQTVAVPKQNKMRRGLCESLTYVNICNPCNFRETRCWRHMV